VVDRKVVMVVVAALVLDHLEVATDPGVHQDAIMMTVIGAATMITGMVVVV
jgi:hypothetical protein